MRKRYEGVPIVGENEEHIHAMEAHLHLMISMRSGHEIQMPVIRDDILAELNRDEEVDGKPNMIYIQLLKVELASHCTALDYINCQLAFLHAMGVPGVPVPVIPSFIPEGEKAQ